MGLVVLSAREHLYGANSTVPKRFICHDKHQTKSRWRRHGWKKPAEAGFPVLRYGCFDVVVGAVLFVGVVVFGAVFVAGRSVFWPTWVSGRSLKFANRRNPPIKTALSSNIGQSQPLPSVSRRQEAFT